MKKISLLIASLVVAGAVFIWASGIVTAENKGEGTTQRAIFKVENITCGACFSNINAGLVPLEGFSGMGANQFRKRVAVDFTGSLSAEEIRQAITKAGYPATLESVDPILEKESFAFLNARQKGQGQGFGGGCCSGGGLSKLQAQSGASQGGSCCVRPGAGSVSPEPGSQPPPGNFPLDQNL